MIADIAEARLTVAARSTVRDLLERENHSTLSEVASWADDIRLQRPETKPWHYVDIPLDAAVYDHTRDCPDDDCVVAQITAFEQVLAPKYGAPDDRLEALKFLVHFVGDVHQPFHVADHDDRGGNEVHVTGYGSRGNLHSIWDTSMIEADDTNERALAKRLDAAITPDQLAAWATGTPADWATESHLLAIDAYSRLGTPDSGATIAIPEAYVIAEQPVIEGQLERAGVRLAATLNRILQ